MNKLEMIGSTVKAAAANEKVQLFAAGMIAGIVSTVAIKKAALEISISMAERRVKRAAQVETTKVEPVQTEPVQG